MADTMHRTLSAFGLELRLRRNLAAARLADKNAATREKWLALKHLDIREVIDVGANSGQFAAEVRREFPDATIFCFEPLPDVFEVLRRRFDGDSKVSAFNLALGEATGTLTMHRSDFTPSSSLLPMTDLHKREWPASAAHTEVQVQIARLDDWMAARGSEPQCDTLVKLDVQGFELQVIRGARETLRRSRAIVTEVSFETLYEGQASFAALHKELASLGFAYRGNLEQHLGRETGGILLADVIFENQARG
jgi:FkbM family methyltransferase